MYFYIYNRQMCKRLHGKELNNVIRANIFSFSYKKPATGPISTRQQSAYHHKDIFLHH